MDVLDKFFTKYSYKFPKGYPDLKDKQDILLLESILEELGVKMMVNEQEESIIKTLAGKNIDDEVIEKIKNGEDFGIDLENIIFKIGGKSKIYSPKTIDKNDDYTLSDIRKIIDEFEKPIFLTYTDNIRKLRSPFGVRIAQFGSPKKVGDSNFQRLIAINKLLSEFPNKIKVVSKLAPGLGYEEAQVQNLNTVINEIIQQSGVEELDLYIDTKPQNIKISKAEKIQGSGKADLALENNKGKEVFWISYKEGKYTESDGSLAKVPFQQYGSLVTMYNQEYDSEMAEFSSYLKKIIPDFLDAIKNEKKGVSVFENVKYSESNNNKNTPDEDKIFIDSSDEKLVPNDEIKELWGILAWDKFKNILGDKTADVVIVHPKSNFYSAFIEENNKQSKILAGKSVYGLDYPSDEYSRENCNILLQSNGEVEVAIILGENDENPTGINLIIKGSSGHILYNPDLPYKPEDPGYQYTPALNMRHTKALSFSYEKDQVKTIYLAGRLLIYPLGSLKNATEVTL